MAGARLAGESGAPQDGQGGGGAPGPERPPGWAGTILRVGRDPPGWVGRVGRMRRFNRSPEALSNRPRRSLFAELIDPMEAQARNAL